jgi:hypothetical protein
MLQDRPERTQTHPTTREVIAVVPSDTQPELRTLGEDETKQLADYLGVETSELDGPFRVVDASCEGCGRQLTFVDFVQTAVDQGAHERDQLRDVLTGRVGAWITIRGEDGGRGVICIECGQLRANDGYSEYSSSSYAYA